MSSDHLTRLKTHYVAELAHINAALKIREDDVARLRAQKAQVERRLAEFTEAEGVAQN